MRASGKVAGVREVSAVSIGVGLPWDKGVFVQEYWLEGRPFYAIANVSSDTIVLTVQEWPEKSHEVLLGPWVILAHSTARFDATRLLDTTCSLVAFSTEGNSIYGLVRPPRPLPPSVLTPLLGNVLTLDNLNGGGDRNSNIVCLQDSETFDSGQIASVAFTVPENLTLVFPRPLHKQESVLALQPVTILNEVAETVPIGTTNIPLVISDNNLSPSIVRKVTLSLQFPTLSKESMVSLTGRVTHEGGGFSFMRGFLVRVS